jgi:murein L,D-transpeptidase YcbB/YkuD
MEAGANDRWVSLAKKVPVYIVYFTAYERDHQLYFAEDIYKRDTGLKGRVVVAAPN